MAPNTDAGVDPARAGARPVAGGPLLDLTSPVMAARAAAEAARGAEAVASGRAAAPAPAQSVLSAASVGVVDTRIEDRVCRAPVGSPSVTNATGGAEARQGRATAGPVEATAAVPGSGRPRLGVGRLAEVPGERVPPAALIPVAERIGRPAITDVPDGSAGVAVTRSSSACRPKRAATALAAAVAAPWGTATSGRLVALVAPAAMGAAHGAGAARRAPARMATVVA